MGNRTASEVPIVGAERDPHWRRREMLGFYIALRWRFLGLDDEWISTPPILFRTYTYVITSHLGRAERKCMKSVYGHTHLDV